MQNIRAIFLRDIYRLRTNIIAIIVMLGVCILPSLYAWFNIAAVWDPYGNTGDIPVAVVNQDKGTSINGLEMNVGDVLVEKLKANDKMGWNFKTKKQAMKGIKEGKFYAVIVIPKNFSKDMVSFTTGDIKRPEMIYYVNEKKNGIAPKITDKGMETVQAQVNSNFIGTMASYVTDFLKIGSENTTITKEDISNRVNETLDESLNNLHQLKSSVQTFESTIDSLIPVLDSSKTLNRGVARRLSSTEKDLQAHLNAIKAAHSGIDNDILPSADGIFNDVENKMSSAIDSLDTAKSSSNDAEAVLANLGNSMASVNRSLASTETLIDQSIDNVETAKEKISSLNISDNFINTLNKAIENPEKISEFMSSPVKLITTPVYPVVDYGSTMAPFYTTLAIWVGGVIMVALFKTSVNEDDEIKNITLRQAYLGRFNIFVIIGMIQAFIIGMGDMFFLHMQATNPVLFILVCLISAFVYTLIIYTLTVSFGNIGKALAVIWLVIQVAGSGGTYPIEVLPDSFKAAAYFMPFTFSCNAMRETIAGIYTPDFIVDILKLLCFVPGSLLLGLVLRNPLYRLNEFFEKRLEDTEFMG